MDQHRSTQRSQNSQEPDAEHLLRALLDAHGGLVLGLLEKAGVEPLGLRHAMAAEFARRPNATGSGAPPGQVFLAQRLARLLDTLDTKLAHLCAEADANRTQWEAQQQAIRRMLALRDDLERVRRVAEAAERSHGLDPAVVLRPGRLSAVDIRVPGDGERAEPGLAEICRQRVIGQDEAVRLVADAIVRARSDGRDPHRPIASFVFLGPTGVGKAELARTLAAALFDSEDNVIRLDMSQYQEPNSVGRLTDVMRRRPYAVVLFDEIEKAHRDVLATLAQVLDHGRIIDRHGGVADFRDTVLIMTSDIGSAYLLDAVSPHGQIKPEARALVLGELDRHFLPGFLNHIDDVVLFRPLGIEEIERIVDLRFDDLRAQLAEREIAIEVTDAARGLIAVRAYDPAQGARPLRRYLARDVETWIGRGLLAGDVPDGLLVVVDVRDDELLFSYRNMREPTKAA